MASDPIPGEDLARSIIAKAQRSQRALSPWVQRWLQPDRPQHQVSPLPLTTDATRRIVGQVQRVTASGLWTGLGSLQPALVDRFAGRIIRRFPAMDRAEGTQPLEIGPDAYPDLILSQPSDTARPAALAIEPDVAETDINEIDMAAETAEEAPPLPQITMKELRERLASRDEPRSETAAKPPTPPLQRSPAQPAETDRPIHPALRPAPTGRPLPPRARRYFKVEEMPPSAGRMPPPAPMSREQPQSPVETGRASLQRQGDEPEPSEEFRPVTGQSPPDLIQPAIQREPENMLNQAESPVEITPSLPELSTQLNEVTAETPQSPVESRRIAPATPTDPPRQRSSEPGQTEVASSGQRQSISPRAVSPGQSQPDQPASLSLASLDVEADPVSAASSTTAAAVVQPSLERPSVPSIPTSAQEEPITAGSSTREPTPRPPDHDRPWPVPTPTQSQEQPVSAASSTTAAVVQPSPERSLASSTPTPAPDRPVIAGSSTAEAVTAQADPAPAQAETTNDPARPDRIEVKAESETAAPAESASQRADQSVIQKKDAVPTSVQSETAVNLPPTRPGEPSSPTIQAHKAGPGAGAPSVETPETARPESPPRRTDAAPIELDIAPRSPSLLMSEPDVSKVSQVELEIAPGSPSLPAEIAVSEPSWPKPAASVDAPVGQTDEITPTIERALPSIPIPAEAAGTTQTAAPTTPIQRAATAEAASTTVGRPESEAESLSLESVTPSAVELQPVPASTSERTSSVPAAAPGEAEISFEAAVAEQATPDVPEMTWPTQAETNQDPPDVVASRSADPAPIQRRQEPAASEPEAEVSFEAAVAEQVTPGGPEVAWPTQAETRQDRPDVVASRSADPLPIQRRQESAASEPEVAAAEVVKPDQAPGQTASPAQPLPRADTADQVRLSQSAETQPVSEPGLALASSAAKTDPPLSLQPPALQRRAADVPAEATGSESPVAAETVETDRVETVLRPATASEPERLPASQVVEESSRPPLAALTRPALPEVGSVSARPAGPMALPPARPILQRRQAQSGLAETILARAEARQGLPLTDLTGYTRPNQADETAVESEQERLPLAATRLTTSRPTTFFRSRSVQPRAAEVVQPLAENGADLFLPLRPAAAAVSEYSPSLAAQAPSGMVFRQDDLPELLATTSQPGGDEIGQAQPNLDDLARQIYPLIKRMLAVERQRRRGR